MILKKILKGIKKILKFGMIYNDFDLKMVQMLYGFCSYFKKKGVCDIKVLFKDLIKNQF